MLNIIPSKNYVLAMPLAIAAVCISVSAEAQSNKAEASARQLIGNLGAQKYQTVWDQETSGWFKQRTTENAFLANMTMGRASLGNLNKVTLVSTDHSIQDPTSGYQGDIYVFTFRDTYSVGDFFERIVVIKENDGEYRLSGIFGSPAPK